MNDTMKSLHLSGVTKRRLDLFKALQRGGFLHLDHIMEAKHVTEDSNRYDILFKANGERMTESPNTKV